MAVKQQQQPSTALEIGKVGYTGARLYSTATGWIGKTLYANAYKEAIGAGLSEAAATQTAEQAATNTLTESGAAIGDWLPWIGAGLVAYQALTKGIHGGQEGLAAASFASMPWTGPFGLAAGAFFTIPKLLGRGPDYDKHIYLHEPDLELIHQDEEGNYYLYDKNTQRGGKALKSSHSSTLNNQEHGKGSLIKYNPETNEMSTGNIGYHGEFKPGSWTKKTGEEVLSLDQAKELFETGQTTFSHEHYPRLKNKDQTPRITDKAFDLADIKWSDFNSEVKAGFGGRGSKSFYNMPSLQSQLYNEVLMPGGFVPESETQSITAGGQQYQADSSGMVFDSNNRIVGQINNSGQIQTFQKEGNRISYGDIDESTSLGNIGTSTLLGTVDNWNQVKQSFSSETASKVLGEQPTDNTKPTIPQVSPQPTPGLPDFLKPTFPGISTGSPQKPTQAQSENELPSFSMPGPLNFNQGVQNMALPPFLQKQPPSSPGSPYAGVQRYISPDRYAGSEGNVFPHRQLRPNELIPPNQQQGGGDNISGEILIQRLANFLRQQGQQLPSPQKSAPHPMIPGFFPELPEGFMGDGGLPSNQPANLPNPGPPPPPLPQQLGGQQSAAGQPGQPKNLSSFLNILKSLAQSGQLRD